MDQKAEPILSSFIELVCKIACVIFIIPHAGYFAVVLTEPVIWVIMALQLAYSFYVRKKDK